MRKAGKFLPLFSFQDLILSDITNRLRLERVFRTYRKIPRPYKNPKRQICSAYRFVSDFLLAVFFAFASFSSARPGFLFISHINSFIGLSPDNSIMFRIKRIIRFIFAKLR